MVDMKKLMALSKEEQLDIIKCKVEVAREALSSADNQPDEVKAILREYLVEAEKTLELASWKLR